MKGINYRAIFLALLLDLAACRNNPFGNTPKPNEDFQIYLSDFSAETDGGMRGALLDVISSGMATLDCAFSSLTLPEIPSLLIAKVRLGIKVRVAFDADVETSDPGSIALRNSGAFEIVTTPGKSPHSQLLYGNRGGGVMRHNFCLADSNLIYISTAAPDDTQMRKLPQLALKISGPAFGMPSEFLREVNFFSELVFGAMKAKTDFSSRFSALGQPITLYWGPQEDPMDVLGLALASAAQWVDFYSTGYQATNATKSALDVPQVMSWLESAKGLPVEKIFSAQALHDADTKAFTLTQPLLYSNTHNVRGANIFLVDRGLPSARAFIYTGIIRTEANSADDSVLIELGGKFATDAIGSYLDAIANVSTDASNVGDIASPGAVVINEIHWMGSYSNAFISDGGDEFVEFYNTTDAAVNLSGWRFLCTGANGTTSNSGLTIPAATIVGPKSFFTIAAESSGAFSRASYYTRDLAVTNNSTACYLMNAQETVIDTAGDGMSSFDTTATLGTNDTTNKIRRSMERVDPMLPGNNITNWKANSNTAATNQFVAALFSTQTFATPAAANSLALSIALLNPSFESAAAWASITSGTLVYDSAVPAQSGSGIIHYNSLTSSISGREFQSECISASPLSSYTASIWEYVPAANVSAINASLKLWWFSDAACGAPLGQATQTQSPVPAQNGWNLRTYTQTSPAGTQALRLSIRARYATAAECGQCANGSDMIYFDSAGISTP